MVANARRRRPTENYAQLIKVEGARGALHQDVQIHSVRLKGMLAHQIVMFGGEGETLTIRHDSLSRSSFVEGVNAAIRAVLQTKGLTVGLEQVLD